MPPALQVTGLDKAYTPGVPVLEDFSFELARGEVHALMGSNGAGKSTFAKILAGLLPRDAGRIELHGSAYAPRSKAEASRLGIALVLQELNLVPTLSVAENLFLAGLPQRWGLVRRRELAEAARAALETVGLGDLDPATPAGRLGIGRQQLVEIAAALVEHSTILILDEPTAALTGPEIELLFARLDQLKAEGVSAIYISHRMDEIARVADRVTVMRDGRRVATHASGEVGPPQLVREMCGAEIAERTQRGHGRGRSHGRSTAASDAEATAGAPDEEPALAVRDLRADSAVRGVSFEVRRGEILGIAGLIGSGRTETLRALFGADPAEGGEVRIAGRAGLPPRFRSPAAAVAAGLALIPEDRKHDGLLLEQSIAVNATLAAIPRHARGGVLRPALETEAARRVCDRLGVARRSLDQPVAELSGGNQQKVVVARWLLRGAEVFLFDEPTRGIDVAAKETLYELLDELAAQGRAILMVSSDLSELLSVADRILAMSAGRIAGEFTPESWSEEAITAAAFSGYRSRAANASHSETATPPPPETR